MHISDALTKDRTLRELQGKRVHGTGVRSNLIQHKVDIAAWHVSILARGVYTDQDPRFKVLSNNSSAASLGRVLYRLRPRRYCQVVANVTPWIGSRDLQSVRSRAHSTQTGWSAWSLKPLDAVRGHALFANAYQGICWPECSATCSIFRDAKGLARNTLGLFLCC